MAERLYPFIESLARDKSVAVRAVNIQCLLALLNTHRDKAVELFIETCEGNEALWTLDLVEDFLYHATFTHYTVLRPLLHKMLATARTRLQDAQRTDNSMETRFDCAYTAIRAVADAALHAQGWRTSTSKPGHHQTTIGCLVHTLGVSPATVRVLDALRKQRNLSDYDGELVTEQALRECLQQAQTLSELAQQKLAPLLNKNASGA